MARGRPQRPYKCSWDGDLVEGLYKCPDGPWRINATGEKFSEPDERRAVQRFYEAEARHKAKAEPVLLPILRTDPIVFRPRIPARRRGSFSR